MSTQTEMTRLGIEKPTLPAWVARKQPQNSEYWQAVYEWAAITKKREEIGEIPPPYHNWWTPY